MEELNLEKIKAESLQVMNEYNRVSSLLHDKRILLEAEINRLNKEKSSIEEQIAYAKSRGEDLVLIAKALQTIIDKSCAENLEKITDTVNLALKSVFPDQELSFGIDVTVKRNVPNYELYISQNGVKGSLESFGGGVLSVVSVVLKVVLNVMTKSAPIICLDETLSGLSVEYIPMMSKLLKEICSKFGIYLILVTHQDKFLIHCDYAYKVRAIPNSTLSQVERIDVTREATCNTEE